MSKLSIWILEDYGTNNKWTLKHTMSLHKFGYFDFQSSYRAVIVYPEWNLIFFVGEERTITAYDMDRRKVHVILTSVDQRNGRRKVLSRFMSRPYFLPYVPLLLFLESLAEH